MIAGATLAVWLLCDRSSMLLSQTGGTIPTGPGGQLEMVSTMLPTGAQQIVILDSSAQTLAVYHIEPTQGKLQLKSVRNLTWDLRMEQFNGLTPLPSELRQVQP